MCRVPQLNGSGFIRLIRKFVFGILAVDAFARENITLVIAILGVVISLFEGLQELPNVTSTARGVERPPYTSLI